MAKSGDFFNYPDVKSYINTSQFNEQLSDLIAVLQNRDYAKQYYDSADFIDLHSDLFGLSPDIIKNIIEGCPLFLDDI